MCKYAAFAFAFGIAFSAIAQAPLAIYTDNLVNGFQDWSWATRNLSHTSPTHSGNDSISAALTAWGALSFENSAFNVTPCTVRSCSDRRTAPATVVLPAANLSSSSRASRAHLTSSRIRRIYSRGLRSRRIHWPEMF